MRSFTSSRPAWSASSTARAPPTEYVSWLRSFHGISRTVSSQVRIQPASGPWSLGAFELVDLLQGRLADLVGEVGGLYALAVVLLLGGRLAVELGQLLADRGQLAAQQELTLLLVHAVLHVLADRLGDVQLGQVLPAPGQQLLQPPVDAGRLQELDLLLLAQVRGVPGRVGQRRGVGDGLHDVHDLPRLAVLQDGDRQLLVLLGQLAGAAGDRRLVLRHGLDPQRGAGAGGAHADAGAPGAAHDRDHAADLLLMRPVCSTTPITPTFAYVPVRRGTSSTSGLPLGAPWRPEAEAEAASSPARVSASERLSGTTMPGRTTASSSGITGKVRVPSVSLIWCGSLVAY